MKGNPFPQPSTRPLPWVITDNSCGRNSTERLPGGAGEVGGAAAGQAPPFTCGPGRSPPAECSQLPGMPGAVGAASPA